MVQRRTARGRLIDIDEAITKIQQFLAGKDLASFTSDSMLHDAVVRNLEILSEASRFLPEELRALEPEIPWRNIADIGNWMRHGYDILNDGIIWETIQRDIPVLQSAVSALLRSMKNP